MSDDKYILDADGNPVPEPNLIKWGLWFEENRERRRIARDELADGHVVSTVFLGIDHGWRQPQPILFETMVFNDYGSIERDEFFDRYATRAEALAGHARILGLVQEWLERGRISERVSPSKGRA